MERDALTHDGTSSVAGHSAGCRAAGTGKSRWRSHRFGPDGKLYIYMGDIGRRGQMQNLPDGHGCTTPPNCPTIPVGNLPDDQFGGPEPDNAHLTGVILRLNDDGTSPQDNPFFPAGATRGGEPGANLQKVFAYGIRNGFGMAFDPVSGRLWEAQNGDDSFTEINLVEPGANLGWIQIMGPLRGSVNSRPSKPARQRIRFSATSTSAFNRCDGRRPTSPTRDRRRSRDCSWYSTAAMSSARRSKAHRRFRRSRPRVAPRRHSC